LFVLSVLSIALGQSFDGTYADSEASGGYGGLLHLCVNDDKIEGMYSEFGIVQGEVTGNFASGEWYEPGVEGQECTTGKFSLTLSDDARGFRGFYTCSERPSELLDWVEEKVNFTTPSDRACARLASSGVFEGNYQSVEENASICTDDDGDVWYSSYTRFNSGDEVPGRESGHIVLDFRVVLGTFVEQNLLGTTMRFLKRGGGISTVYYGIPFGEFPSAATINPQNQDPDYHAYFDSTFLSDADDEDCQHNRLVDYGENTFFSYPLTPDSSSNVLAVSFGAVVAFVALALFV
jgi:hypothetical protein